MKITDMTRFRVFGGGWVQSSTFFDFFSLMNILFFIGLYASLYIGDKKLTNNLEKIYILGVLYHLTA